MKRKIITFLGTHPRETQYKFSEGEVVTAGTFAEALARHEKFDQMLVCVTPTAMAQTYPSLAALKDARIVPVQIPEVRTEEQIWLLFDVVTRHIDVDDDLMFDVTHGLRSLPFLTFLFAVYARALRGAHVSRVLYGAPELGVPAPVIDLTSAITMFEWISAVTQFNELGHGAKLSSLIGGLAADPNRRIAEVGALALAVAETSHAVELAQPLSWTNHASILKSRLDAMNMPGGGMVSPLSTLASPLQREYARFAGPGDLKPSTATEILARQIDMLDWYLARGRLTQCATLASEVLVSLFIAWLKQPGFMNFETRRAARNALGAIRIRGNRLMLRNPKQAKNDVEITVILSRRPPAAFFQAWSELTRIRNAIAHCGMSDHQPISPNAVSNTLQALTTQHLRALHVSVFGPHRPDSTRRDQG